MTSDETLARAVFEPRVIGLIGLSSNPGTPAGRPLPFLRAAGSSAKIIVVNPRRETVQGEPAYPSLAAAPEIPDHAYILVGAERVEQAVRDCAEAGVKVATVLADGYAESGPEGVERQNRLIEIARTSGMRLLGPNSMGVADLASGLLLTVNAIYQEPDPLVGSVSLISQSGSMMGGLISRARALGIGFARTAAVGNESDLGVAELGQMMLADPATKVVLLFMETIRDAEGLARLAAAAHEVGKPVIAYKLGRSTMGAQMAVAHTGALLAEDAVADAFLREIGIARVRTLDGLIEAARLFQDRVPFTQSPRIGVVTTTGGGGATVCDQLALEGVAIHPPSAATLAAARATGVDVVQGPMIDLTMAGAGPDFVRPTIEAIAADTDVDMVLSITGSSGRSNPERTLAGLVDLDLGGKPLAAFVVPEAVGTLAQLIDAGVPAFRTPESAADAVGALCRWRTPRVSTLGRTPVDAKPHVLNEERSLAMLADMGVPIVQSVAAEIGETPDLPFNYPVVAKVLSDQVPHKTDAGGVVLGIKGPEELISAGRQIQSAVAAHQGLQIDQILIAPMISALQEVLIGYRLDPQVGPIITLAPGGILVGLYDDKAVRLAPVDLPTAHEMIDEVVGLAPLRGYRGLPLGDLNALAKVIAAFSDLATADATVLEAEANPVMVTKGGAIAVDALVTIAAPDTA